MRKHLIAVVLAAALVVIFALDWFVDDNAFVQYLCIPVIVGAGLCSARVTVLLAVASIGLALTTGALVRQGHDESFWVYSSTTFWVYVLANSLACGGAVWLAFRREGAERRREIAEYRVSGALEDLQLAIEASPLGTALISVDGLITSVNAAMSQLTGHSREQLVGRQIADLLIEQDRNDRRELRDALLDDPNGTVTLQHRMVTADGRIIWARERIAVTRDRDGDARGFITVFEDVTAEVEQLDLLQNEADRDPLTGLLNRRGLTDEITALSGPGRRVDYRIAVIFIDVDGLKKVNDTQGHEAGDTLISTVAARLSGSVRDQDLVARVGGDEFVIALAGINSLSQAEHIAKKVLSGVDIPLDIDGVPHPCSISVGVALEDTGQRLTEDAFDALISRADAAQYRAKRAGGNRVMVDEGTARSPADASP